MVWLGLADCSWSQQGLDSGCRLASESFLWFLILLGFVAPRDTFLAWQKEKEVRSSQVTEAHFKPLLTPHPATFYWPNQGTWPSPTSGEWGNTHCPLEWKILQSHSAKVWGGIFWNGGGAIDNKPIYHVLSIPVPSSSVIKFCLSSFCFSHWFLTQVPFDSHPAPHDSLLHVFPQPALISPPHHLLHASAWAFFLQVSLHGSCSNNFSVQSFSNRIPHMPVISVLSSWFWSICITPVLLLLFNISFTSF